MPTQTIPIQTTSMLMIHTQTPTKIPTQTMPTQTTSMLTQTPIIMILITQPPPQTELPTQILTQTRSILMMFLTQTPPHTLTPILMILITELLLLFTPT